MAHSIYNWDIIEYNTTDELFALSIQFLLGNFCCCCCCIQQISIENVQIEKYKEKVLIYQKRKIIIIKQETFVRMEYCL